VAGVAGGISAALWHARSVHLADWYIMAVCFHNLVGAPFNNVKAGGSLQSFHLVSHLERKILHTYPDYDATLQGRQMLGCAPMA
jgi:hypothetical protein